MKKINSDFADLIRKYLLTNENVKKEASALILKEECNEFEVEILEYIVQGADKTAFEKFLEYVLPR